MVGYEWPILFRVSISNPIGIVPTLDRGNGVCMLGIPDEAVLCEILSSRT